MVHVSRAEGMTPHQVEGPQLERTLVVFSSYDQEQNQDGWVHIFKQVPFVVVFAEVTCLLDLIHLKQNMNHQMN